MNPVIQLFEGVRSAYPGLQMELREKHDSLDLLLAIPRQPGLQFEVSLYLDGDELHIATGAFWVEWFPSTDPAVRRDYREAVDGILSGQYRIVEHYRRGTAVKAELQKPTPEGWSKVAAWGRAHVPIPWRTKTKVVQNVPQGSDHRTNH